MLDARNPYAPPQATLDPNRIHTDSRAMRDGKVLVLEYDAAPPPRCVKCNAPALEPIKPRRLYWHHPGYCAIIFFQRDCLRNHRHDRTQEGAGRTRTVPGAHAQATHRHWPELCRRTGQHPIDRFCHGAVAGFTGSDCGKRRAEATACVDIRGGRNAHCLPAAYFRHPGATQRLRRSIPEQPARRLNTAERLVCGTRKARLNAVVTITMQ